MSDEPQSISDYDLANAALDPDQLAKNDLPVEPFRNVNVVAMALFVEGGMACLALALGYFGVYDHSQALASLGMKEWTTGIVWGVLGTIPLLVYLAVFHFKPPKAFLPMKTFVEDQLKPLFSRLSLWELLFISMMAGVCEELLFRWCLQGGITSLIGTREGTVLAIVSVSVLFGLCHWVNASYGITTAVVGFYFGVLMLGTGSFLAPAIAHFLFDFVALIYIGRFSNGAIARTN